MPQDTPRGPFQNEYCANNKLIGRRTKSFSIGWRQGSRQKSRNPSCSLLLKIMTETDNSDIAPLPLGTDKKDRKPGVVYLSRIPPTMTPHEIRTYLEPFGQLGRLYLAPDERTLKNNILQSSNPRDRMKARYTEGWIEFLRRKDAKTAALALNGNTVGGKKSNRFHDEIWNIKYLKGFEWSNLTEQATYQKAVRQQRMRAEITQSRRINQMYVKQAEKAKEMSKIEQTKMSKKAKAAGSGDYVTLSAQQLAEEQRQVLQQKFRQRKPIVKSDD